MKNLALLAFLAFASCATDYQPQGFTGGYSDFLTAPDEAVITLHGNGYTSVERVGQMAALRCAEVTVEHGYRYFVLVGASDVSGTSSFTTLGYAHTYGSAFATGNIATGTATTTITPPQTYRFFKPGVMLSIKMSNNEKSLEPYSAFVFGYRTHPKDAAFLRQSLRQYLGIKSQS
jgi:hypothetical protein